MTGRTYISAGQLQNFCRILLFSLSALILLVSPPPPAFAQANNQITISAEAGFDGYIKEGAWFPIFVTLENTGPDLEGFIEVRITHLYENESIYQAPVSLPTTSKKVYPLYLFPENIYGNHTFEVRLVVDGKSAASTPTRVTVVSADSRLFGVFAGDPDAFLRLAELDNGLSDAFVAQLSLNQLPDQAQILNSLDGIVFSDIDTSQMTPAQVLALEQWSFSGGQLVIFGGSTHTKTAEGLGDLLPVTSKGSLVLDDLQAAQAFAGSPATLPGEMRGAAVEPLSGGKTLGRSGETPLVVRKALGYGSITYLNLDAHLEPLRSWPGLVDLFRRSFDFSRDRAGWSYGILAWNSAYSAAETITQSSLPSAFITCGFLILYFLIIGPLNFYLLQRWKRKDLAWVTVPGLVIIFSGATFFTGSQIRGSEAIVNKAALVQIWPGVPTARVDGIVGVFSPARKTYDLRLAPGWTANPVPVEMGSQPIDWTFQQSAQGWVIEDVPIEIGAIQTFGVQGFTPAPDFPAQVTMLANASSIEIQAELSNNSNITLLDPVLFAMGEAHPLEDFSPGQDISVNFGFSDGGKAAQSGTPLLGGAGNPYVWNDMWLADLVGTQNYYEDRKSFLRYSLLSAFLSSSMGTHGPGAGVYLLGWANNSPIPLDLFGHLSQDSNNSLYIIKLEPEIQYDEGVTVLPPGLFTWEAMSSGQMDQIAPYGTYLYGGTSIFRYNLAVDVAYKRISQLVLNLNGSSDSPDFGISLALWDYAAEQWVELDVASWGNHVVEVPSRFVNEQTEIQVRVETVQGASIRLEALDFTLQVEK